MPYCVYCGQTKDEGFSDEHILPRAIGGNLLHNQLKIRVCQRCNNTLGMFVDGPFVKSWTISNHHASDALRYVDFDGNPGIQLCYMGISTEFSYGSKICEVWLGPTGDIVLHFHEPYPEQDNIPPMVGIPAYCRGRRGVVDPGFVITYLRSNNPVWIRPIPISIQETFEHSALYVGNMLNLPHGERFADIPDELRGLSCEIFERLHRGRDLTVDFRINTHYADRFLAKLSLAIGAHVLNESFLYSQSATLLRNDMWEGNQARRAMIPFRGTALLPPQDQLTRFLSWPGGHLLCLLPTRGVLALFSSFNEVQCSAVVISDEPDHWREQISADDGICFVFAPGLRRYVGPKRLSNLIAHKVEDGQVDLELADLEDEMQRHSALPPFVIED